MKLEILDLRIEHYLQTQHPLQRILHRYLKSIVSEYEQALVSIQERMADLMVPFQRRWYYHSALNGSYLIKAVLPALIPELSYKNLNIQEGGTASLVYTQLKYQDKEVASAQRNDLWPIVRLIRWRW